MSCRTNEVEAGMDSEIDLVLSFWLLLLQHVRLVLVVKEFYDRHPGVSVVDIVAEARCVNNSQADCAGQHCCLSENIAHTFEELLFQFSLRDLNLHRLVDLLGMSSLMVLIILDGG
jgi:hypothetical protein